MNLLCVDVEGSEWFVIKHMISRPAIISLETHGAIYVNPYIDRNDWAFSSAKIIMAVVEHAVIIR